MGMVNQLNKFTPNIAELSQPLRELLSTKRAWVWGSSQDAAFEAIKKELTQPTVLALYDVDAELKISSNASAYGLGAVLLQRHSDSQWKPVAYASRCMSDTERRYSQIEKEALGIVWACEKFADFVIGKRIALETDHKPLVPLLTPHTLTVCLLAYFDSDSDSRASTIQLYTESSSCAQLMHSHVPRWSQLHKQMRQRRRNSLSSPSWHPYQQARGIWTSTVRLNMLTQSVASSSSSRNTAGQTDTR